MTSSVTLLSCLSILVFLVAASLPVAVRSQEASHSDGATYHHGGGAHLNQTQRHEAFEGRKVYNKMAANSVKKQSSDDLSPASVLSRLDWRSLFTTAMKMFFGNGDEQSKQASRQLVSMIISLVDGLRLSFTMRKAQARSSGGEVALPTADAALASLSMLKAYVKTITSEDDQCVKKYLCQANREAVKDGNKIGYLIAQAGSYATSYVLENIRYSSFDENFNAGKDGRNGVNCEETFSHCNELL